MAVLMLAEIPGVTTAQYDQVNEQLGIQSAEDVSESLVNHVAGTTDGGIYVADVWDSPEEFERFFAERAGPAFGEAGVPPVEPRILPVHNVIRRGAGTEANVLVVIEADGFTPELYDEITSKLAAHQGDGSSHPAVSHVAATTPTGMVFVDVWDSAESFGRFAEEQLGPAAGGAESMSALQPRFVPVHNRLAAGAPAAA